MNSGWARSKAAIIFSPTSITTIGSSGVLLHEPVLGFRLAVHFYAVPITHRLVIAHGDKRRPDRFFQFP